MPYDENFNSSDVEIPPQDSEDGSANTGRRAITRIVQGSVQDRTASKVAIKSLNDVSNAPSTARSRKYWYKLFSIFASTTLGLERRPNSTPTAEDYLRFLTVLPDLVTGRNPLGNGAMAWSTLKSAEYSLNHSLTFHYQGWALSKRDAVRIDALLIKHLRDGRVTKHPYIQKQWISAMLVRQMVMALFRNAINNGTRSWDVVVHKCLSLVLQAATSSRTGDIRQSSHYKDPVYLRWEHIVIKMKKTPEKPSMRMLIKLFHTKGHKDDPKAVRHIDLQSLTDEDGHNNVVDPVKLLLIYALRLGVVRATSWATLVQDTLASPGHTVQWTCPDSPVLFGLSLRAAQIDLSRAAPANQQLRILREAADLIGMIVPPVTHDLRRGAAQGLAAISKSIHNETAARKGLGHSSKSFAAGTTDRYSGRGAMTDTWKLLTEDDGEPDPFGPDIALTPFQSGVVKTSEIEALCEEENLDKTNTRDRHTASTLIAKRRRDQWNKEQRNALANPIGPPSDASDRTERSTTTKKRKRPESLDPNMLLPTTKPGKEFGPRPTATREEENIDPRLRSWATADLDSVENDEDIAPTAETMKLGSFFGWPASAEEPTTDEQLIDIANTVIESNDHDNVADNQGGNAIDDVLVGPANAFVDYMSRVNEVAIHRHRPDLSVLAAEGNSRNSATHFKFACHFDECFFEAFTEYDRQTHEARCKSNPTNIGPQTPMVPNEPDNASALTSKATTGDQPSHDRPKRAKRTKVERLNENETFSAQCPDRAECGHNQIFTNRNTYENHRTRFHSSWPPTKCKETGCKTIWNSRVDYRDHLQSVHKLPLSAVGQILDEVQPLADAVPRGTSASYTESMCLWNDCPDLRQFPTYKKYAKHVYSYHKATAAQLVACLPTITTRKLREMPDLPSVLHRQFPNQGQHCTYTAECEQAGTFYQSRPVYARHLKHYHGVPDHEVGLHMTGAEVIPFHATECLYPDCKSRAKIHETSVAYNAHLHRVHSVDEEDRTKYWLWSVHHRGVPT